MSSNVGLPTPRGSGTSGYVQRNYAFLKPRINTTTALSDGRPGGDTDTFSFKQRQPDKQILEHDRRRAIEVKVLEERERLEEQQEEEEEEAQQGRESEEEVGKGKKKTKKTKFLSEEEIDERCEVLRRRLIKEFSEEGGKADTSANINGDSDRDRDRDRHRNRDVKIRPRDRSASPRRERRQFKTHQVHELAEAKIEETERLRRALGIREDWEGRSGRRRQGDEESERRRGGRQDYD